MDNREKERAEEIAKALTIQALSHGGNSAFSLVGDMGTNGQQVGGFVGELYATVLAKVKAANGA